MACAVSPITGTLRVAASALTQPGRLPAVDDRQAHVHQDDVGLFAAREIDALLAVHGEHHLEAAADQPAREHVAVHFVVFDQQNLRHWITLDS